MDTRSENEHLEFKEAKNRFDFEKLVGYCVALANERGGKMILGVSDKLPRKVVFPSGQLLGFTNDCILRSLSTRFTILTAECWYSMFPQDQSASLSSMTGDTTCGPGRSWWECHRIRSARFWRKVSRIGSLNLLV